MHRALAARAGLRDVYQDGAYRALSTTGFRRECLFAFARGGRAMTLVPRLVTTLTPDAAAPPIGPGVWGDTRVELPDSVPGRSFREVFTGATIEADEADGARTIAAAAAFEQLPVALLVPCSI